VVGVFEKKLILFCCLEKLDELKLKEAKQTEKSKLNIKR
jgi:hypothetical protein